MSKQIIILAAAFVCTLGAPNVRYDPNLNWRVIGGKPATTGQFPFIVSLRKNSHTCGGSILNNEWILTAAHCLVGTQPSSLTVVAGSALLDQGGVSRKVSKVIPHNEFNQFTTQNDIGLVKLAEPLEFDENIQPIPRETEDVQGGNSVTLVGWGTTTFPGSVPNNLQYAELVTVSTEECKERHSPLSVYDSQVCTDTKNGEGACHGDSGGPLFGENGKQVGIVSWGRPCAVGYPDVFTRISSHNSWIEANMK